MSDNTKTLPNSPPLNLTQTESQLTLFAEGSLARTSPSQGGGQEWAKAHAADYGASTPVLLANYDHATSSWRTSQHCLVEGLTVYSETWPRSGTMQSGIAYQLPALVRLTDEIGFGLWLTPQSEDAKACYTGSQNQVMLAHQVLFPTPSASDHRGAGKNGKLRDRLDYAAERGATKNKMWPTPRAGGDTLCVGSGHRLMLVGTELETGRGKLNPTWVEWLMGFPPGWTDLNHSETLLSHKYQNSLDEQS